MVWMYTNTELEHMQTSSPNYNRYLTYPIL